MGDRVWHATPEEVAASEERVRRAQTFGAYGGVREVHDFAERISDFMTTRVKPWKDEPEMRAAAETAVRLVFEDAFHETWEIAKRVALTRGLSFEVQQNDGDPSQAATRQNAAKVGDE